MKLHKDEKLIYGLVGVLILLAAFLFCAKAQSDTFYLNGTTKISFNVHKPVSYYWTDCSVPYTTANATTRTISGVGKVLFKLDGSGTFQPVANYKGTWKYYTPNCGFKESFITFMTKPIAPPIPTNTYTLAVQSTTSAGVFKSDVLIRTLWNNVKKDAGTYSVSWDGKDDNGNAVDKTGCTIKVITHQMTYTWDASIGNSSRMTYGANKIRAARTLWNGVEAGNNLYFCTGFVEGNTSLIKFAKNDIRYMIPIRYSNRDIDAEVNYCATDGTNIYWCGFDAWGYYTGGSEDSHVDAMIFATKVSDDKDVTFSSGVTTKLTLADRTYNAIGVIKNNTLANPTGFAVSSSYLYCTHSKLNQVRVYNKVTGTLVQTLNITLGAIAIEGNTLYGISGNNVVAHTINSNGTLTAAGFNVALNQPINVSVRNGLIIVIEYGTQQVKAYNTSGVLQWTLGQLNGYKNSPLAANDKFYFRDPAYFYPKGYVTQCIDGSFWIGDAGNFRNLHFAADMTFIEDISYIPQSYNCAAYGDRVFSTFIEFSATTGKFVANWEANVPDAKLNPDRRKIFYNLFTIQGKVFGTVHHDLPEVVELSSTGLRFTGQDFGDWSTDYIEANGDRIHWEYNISTTGTKNLTKQPLIGLTNGNPTWGASQIITSVPLSTVTPSHGIVRPNSQGYFFEENKDFLGYHFGRVVNGKWVFLTSKSTPLNYSGAFPTNGDFDCYNNVNYAGNRIDIADSFVAWGYHGENWKSDQTMIFNLFHQSGLMLMQIGKTGVDAANNGLPFPLNEDAPEQSAGNCFDWRLVKSVNNYVIYHNDESRQGAIGRETITGANTIKIFYLVP